MGLFFFFKKHFCNILGLCRHILEIVNKISAQTKIIHLSPCYVLDKQTKQQQQQQQIMKVIKFQPIRMCWHFCLPVNHIRSSFRKLPKVAPAFSWLWGVALEGTSVIHCDGTFGNFSLRWVKSMSTIGYDSLVISQSGHKSFYAIITI